MNGALLAVARSFGVLIRVLLFPAFAVAATGLALVARLQRRKDPKRFRLGWGVYAAPKFAYASKAMRQGGWQSETVVETVQHMNRREDFDRFLYRKGTTPLGLVVSFPRWVVGRYLEFLRALFAYDVVHHLFDGCFLGETWIWRLERFFLRLAGVRSVVMAAGGDFFQYSRVREPALLHTLLTLKYDISIRREEKIAAKVAHWVRHADVIIADSTTMEGRSRWEVIPVRAVPIDTDAWRPRDRFSDHDGRSGPVTLVHSSNHRGYTGTEFVIQAVERLRDDGLDVALRLLEGVPNRELQRVVREEGDILVENIVTAYSLTAIEGMACALPVLSNFSNEMRYRVFRRYSYLNECPIVSTTPETVVEELRLLVTNPRLRRELGRAGREYVQKYHSYEAARFLFSSIYDHLAGKPVELLNLYHPVLGPDLGPRVQHPLRESSARHLMTPA